MKSRRRGEEKRGICEYRVNYVALAVLRFWLGVNFSSVYA